MEDVRGAGEVMVATYMYDHPELHKALIRRLGQRSTFSLIVMVDKEAFGGQTPYFQRSRLAALRENGATVYLCRGERGQGSYHRKALVIDRRYSYSGGANYTRKSTDNKELVYRIAGPPVDATVALLSSDQRDGCVWDGS